MKESDILRDCLDFLRIKGIFAFRVNTTGVYDPNRQIFRASPNTTKGISDIIAIQPKTGKMMAIEVKKPGGKVSDNQQSFLDHITRNNGIAMVVHSIEELEEDLRSVQCAL